MAESKLGPFWSMVVDNSKQWIVSEKFLTSATCESELLRWSSVFEHMIKPFSIILHPLYQKCVDKLYMAGFVSPRSMSMSLWGNAINQKCMWWAK